MRRDIAQFSQGQVKQTLGSAMRARSDPPRTLHSGAVGHQVTTVLPAGHFKHELFQQPTKRGIGGNPPTCIALRHRNGARALRADREPARFGAFRAGIV
jgi:hypothetical protein